MQKFITAEQKYYRTDIHTGEVIEQYNSKTIQLKTPEPFFLTYSKQILALYSTDVLNATTKVLYKMLEFAEWNTGKVYMTTDRVEEIMQICSISRASYHRAVKELISKGVIVKGKGSYTITQEMFWKGEAKIRDKIINSRAKLQITPVFEDNDEYITVVG